MRFLECERDNMDVMTDSNGVEPRYALQFELNDKTGMEHREQKDPSISTFSDFLNYQRSLVLVRSTWCKASSDICYM